MWKIGNVTIQNQIVLAPMAGFTNKTFRKICKRFGVGLVVSEMVSDKALVYDSKKTFSLLDMDEEERPIAIQIFGSDKETMGKAAKIVEDYIHPDIIDINMGCPVPKVAIKNKAGSALLKSPEKVYEIVSSVVQSVSVPVTVKIRIGWDEDSINAPLIAKICEKAGAKAIFVHGRTRKQGYSGVVNYDVIKQVKESVKIPVIGNGNITSCYDAKKMLDYCGCDAVMIGRGLLGNPWLIQECLSYLEDGTIKEEVSFKEKIAMMKEHIELLVKDKGEKIAVLELRTILMYYLKGMPNTKKVKLLICNAETKEELLNIIKDYEQNVEKL